MPPLATNVPEDEWLEAPPLVGGVCLSPTEPTIRVRFERFREPRPKEPLERIADALERMAGLESEKMYLPVPGRSMHFYERGSREGGADGDD